MDIFVYKGELSSSRLRPAQNSISDAVDKMNAAVSSAAGAYGYEGRTIFSGQSSELNSCLSELGSLAEKLDKYAAMFDTAPEALIEADEKFGNVLSNGWQRVLYSVSNLFGLFSTGTVTGSTDSGFDADKTVQKNANKGKDDIVDDYRKTYGSKEETVGDKKVVYSSKTTKTVSVLPGSSYKVTRYTDYKELSYSGTTGDSYYSANGELKIHGEHYEIESNDGTVIKADTNALDLGLDGSFDPAKGNAYVKAGAEYDLVKLTAMEAESDYHKASVSAQVGVGGHVNIGFHDGKFTADASAALGIGVSIKLEFNYRETWRHIRSVFA